MKKAVFSIFAFAIVLGVLGSVSSLNARAEDGVSAFVFDRTSGAFTVCKDMPASHDATECGLNWCEKNSIAQDDCGFVHCIFPGWIGIALGQEDNGRGGKSFYAGESCGSRTQAEAKRLAKLRCNTDHTGNCKNVTIWKIAQ
ncbi:hypothetical protein WDW86_01455 [Bdellovibrionota bacterium FG-2]